MERAHRYAFNPDGGGPARIIRFANIGAAHIALYDRERNIVFVNKSLFDRLEEHEREQVLRTHEDVPAYYEWPTAAE